ncbi:MAG: hypothetical protein AABX38_08010 [Candidatus Micrarchaeota archaeon]
MEELVKELERLIDVLKTDLEPKDELNILRKIQVLFCRDRSHDLSTKKQEEITQMLEEKIRVIREDIYSRTTQKMGVSELIREVCAYNLELLFEEHNIFNHRIKSAVEILKIVRKTDPCEQVRVAIEQALARFNHLCLPNTKNDLRIVGQNPLPVQAVTKLKLVSGK